HASSCDLLSFPTRRSSDLDVVADGDVDERRGATVVLHSGAGVGTVVGYRHVGEIHIEVTLEPTAPGRRVAAQRYTVQGGDAAGQDRKSTRLNSSHEWSSYA